MNETNGSAVEPEEAEINLTPMLDVVFIMLIFFIVTAVFIREPGIDITRPAAANIETPKSAVLIAINRDNEIWIDGDEIEMNLVRHRIEQLRTEKPESAVVIQADAESQSEYTLAVMDAAKAAGASSVLLSARGL